LGEEGGGVNNLYPLHPSGILNQLLFLSRILGEPRDHGLELEADVCAEGGCVRLGAGPAPMEAASGLPTHHPGSVPHREKTAARGLQKRHPVALPWL
jgi:hypothetical protein